MVQHEVELEADLAGGADGFEAEGAVQGDGGSSAWLIVLASAAVIRRRRG